MEKIKFRKTKNKSLTLSDNAKAVIHQLLCFSGGFITAFSGGFSGISPFPIAFTCAVKENVTIAAACGSALGYLMSSYIVSGLRYVGILAAIVIIKRAFFSFESISNSHLTAPATAFVCALSTGIVILAAQGFSLDGLLIYSGEAVFAAGCAYFLDTSFRIKKLTGGTTALNSTEIFSLIISVCILLLSLSSITYKNISFVRIISVFLILMCAKFSREAGGSIVGITLGTAMSVNLSSGVIAGAWGLGGLIAGIFAPLGQYIQAGTFFLVHIVFSVLNGSEDAYTCLFEAIIASVVFMIIPKKALEKLRKYFTFFSSIPVAGDMRSTLETRLKTVANAIDDVSQSVDKVSKTLDKITESDITPVCENVRSAVCETCTARSICWEENFEETATEFAEIYDRIDRQGNIVRDDFPRDFNARCCHPEKIAETFSKICYADYLRSETRQQSEQIREIVAEQFKAVSDVLNDIAYEFKSNVRFNNDCASRIADTLKTSGISVFGVSCIEDEKGLTKIEVHAQPISTKFDLNLLSHNIETICRCKFEFPNICYFDNETVLTFTPKNNFTVKFGFYQIPCKGATVCGDCIESCLSPDGKQILILSDGMGTGTKAAVDSTMAAKLFGRLVSSGVSFDSTLQIVNSALLVKSFDETLATLDIVSIDLYTGQAKFYKAGATISVVRKRGRIVPLEKASMPAGILKNINFAVEELNVEDGDIILLMSDGATTSSVKWIYESLQNFEGEPDDLAKTIAQTATQRRRDNHEDDVSVLVAQIFKN